MKIAIASYGRSHLLELARELSSWGHDVHFYSLVSPARCQKFGLKKKNIKGFFFIAGVIEYLCRALPLPIRQIKKLRETNMVLMDHLVSLQLQPCEVFIGMSGVYVKSLAAAKKKYNATLLLDRGCKHILEQYRILNEITGAQKPSEQDINRELAGYALADYVVIASEHVKQSFLQHQYPIERLYMNPYGTTLHQFHPTIKPTAPDAYDVIMVGQWMYRKGCDLLAEVCLNILKIKFLHIGAVVDCPLPNHPLFTHLDPIDQPKLLHYYAQSKVFALASREEGLALVQAQAIACGLPIVCSKDTGGRDLAQFLTNKEWIIEMPETTAKCLAECIQKALIMAQTQAEGPRDYAGEAIHALSWESYGKRYHHFLQSSIREKTSLSLNK